MKHASHYVGTLDDLAARIDSHVAAVHAEIGRIGAQWHGLRSQQAQRDDHAAELLGNLSHPLSELSGLAKRCATLIDDLAANPFGDD